MLIGIVGYKGSGKSTVTDAALRTLTYGEYIRIGFADAMVEMLAALGVPRSILSDKSKWNTPLEILCGKTVRHACTTLGTEWGRDHISVNLWANLTIQKYKKNSNKTVIVDNCRFPSEFVALRDNGAIMVAWDREGEECTEYDHESEEHIGYLKTKCDIRFINRHGLIKSARKWRALIMSFEAMDAVKTARASREQCEELAKDLEHLTGHVPHTR